MTDETDYFAEEKARQAQRLEMQARWLTREENDDDKDKDRHARAAAAAEKAAESERDYAAPFWPTARVLNWIGWRDAKLINKDWLLAQFYPSASGHRPRSNDPGAELLRALQEGKLRAFCEGQKQSAESWSRTPVNALPDVDCRREDVLTRWPPLDEGGHISGEQKEQDMPCDESQKVIPANLIGQYFETKKIVPGPIPSQNACWEEIRGLHPKYRVPRESVREGHRDAFGPQPPGKRPAARAPY
jgi:hypothetical protein